ncbi:MAG: isocitrate/isopropylmalate dehydrogenase family protein [Candidatus Methanoplasma sp.]|jgi:isocitrate dehydrogenase (NAD+)|nr:isocitrate/isopropylmalate dehydrogenase family protein [Candidatus Methanoplasma sp.]
MVDEKSITAAQERYGELLRQQLRRVEELKKEGDWVDYSKLDKLIVGVCGGDGIGPYICASAQKVMEFLLADKLKAGRAEIRIIDGLTIERRAAVLKAIPDDTLEELKKCHVILKGPTTTPSKGDQWPNIESANVAMRKQLDLFANVRPVSVPELGINWTFFRENTEGSYALGSNGIDVTEDLAMDFCVATTQGTDRIIRAGFEFAKKSGLNYLSLVTKANIVKTTDGKFLSTMERIGKEYPEVKWDSWFIDIMTAKLIDPARRSDFKVLVLPNLYGDILTDEAAQIQGGVGTAGSANIGKKYAMFEAIHGSAPRMVDEGRAQYADPCSMIKAVALMMDHIGEKEKGKRLNMALDVCVQFERKLVMTGRSSGATGDEFAQYVMDTVQRPDLEKVWNGYIEKAKAAAK